MYVKSVIPLILITMMIACSPTEQGESNQTKDSSVQPMHFDKKQADIYDNQEPSIGEQGGYIQSEQRGVNQADFSNYSDAFTNEESVHITRALEKQKDIIQAQVASLEDRIVVAVMLREHLDHDVSQRIEKDVKEIVPDTNKQIIVYTDDIQWDRMKNLDTRLKAKTVGDDLENSIKELFQLDD